MSRKKKHTELDYYGLYLLNYLKESHPDKANDMALVEERAQRAANVYDQSFREGYPAAGAQELAMKSLLEGLHFSKYDLLRDVLESEFEGELPGEEIPAFARKLLPLLENVFSIYELTDDFAQSPEHDLLYTELTGAVALYLEEYGI
ncbi:MULTISPECIES: DUF1896 family protein [Bacteroides]|jgi:hypothetical protein|uniref:DUF1896 family protein n=1 Tax=Bacteroides TaxID=816 RepID=UPI000E995DC6|nr:MULTISPECIES: DUF1896 family protein [Bacteroides]MCS2520414.1 DUF1896 domain-containing protein [Bacteroides thetaiotaomicron]RGN44417.1 DUF1896 family protein [Bacteroides sp. OM05-12]RHR72071.1 DUF1896 family protein [Bacteroides sp. AF16-49]